MKVIGDAPIPGIIVGCVGILLAAVNYPIYKKVLGSRKKKYAGEILALSGEVLDK